MNRARGRLLIITALAALLLVAPAAVAQQKPPEPSATELATARQLYAEARAHIEKQEWSEAETKLRAAQKIKNTAGLAFHIGLVQEQQGRLLQAMWSHLDAKDLIDRGAKEPEVAELLGPSLERLEQKIPTLTLVCASPCAARKIEIDGIERKTGALNNPIQLDPGKRSITAYGAGDQRFDAVVDLALGDRKSLEIRFPEPSERGVPQPLTDAPTSPRADKPGGIKWPLVATLAGVTVVALGTGIGFGIAANDSDDRYERHYEELAAISPTACADAANAARCRDVEDAYDDRERQRGLERAMYITAGITAAATLGVLLLWPSKSAASSSARAVRLQANAGPAGAGLSVHGWL